MSRLLYGTFVVLVLLLSMSAQAKPASPADSLVIRFANRTRMVIYAPDKAGIQALSNYDLNKIVREMSMQLDSVPGGPAAIKRDGDQYLKDTVLVVTKTKDGVRIVVGDTDGAKADSTQKKSESDRTDRDYKETRRRNRGDFGRLNFGGSIGLNNYIVQSDVPAYPEDSYDLRPIGSRYFALSVSSTPTLIRGKRASLKLYYGLELAWNNFMFEGNNYAEKTTTGVAFPDAQRDLRKSKLTVCTIGIPVVPRLTFYDSRNRRAGHIGIGMYGNYRLDSYRKIKEADGSRDRRHSNFNLSDFRYGVMTQLGIRNTEFFVKYDLSPLFEEGLGPDLRAISFGISF
ncbi:hypothetical protein GGR92_005179 [Spirosoma lacussanchae]|uniref:outer membrane beta-barrel protein n=1 Tax=Spirosoma lacussanchae TaxID=1884249 RepID=UPI00110980B7|nr:outer membrane beta-barrel protein [Spirosoma lacussanchae]